MTLLHIHHDGESIISFGGFIRSVFLEGILDTLKLLPFLFLTYLLMEFIEHKASDKTLRFMKKSGATGPAVGGALGALPQCAFSAVAANLYTGRVITLGTLVAVFLSTSDEMLPILLSGNVGIVPLLKIIGYKVSVAILCGFIIDITLRLTKRKQEEINIDEICENDECHCEKGIFYSALHHTATISLFVLIVTLVINALVYFIGHETLGSILGAVPVLSHTVAAFVGLIPGCATSVALSTLGVEGIISYGTMLSGLFSSAGVGILILFRMNKHRRENIMIAGILVLCGILFGGLWDILGIM